MNPRYSYTDCLHGLPPSAPIYLCHVPPPLFFPISYFIVHIVHLVQPRRNQRFFPEQSPGGFVHLVHAKRWAVCPLGRSEIFVTPGLCATPGGPMRQEGPEIYSAGAPTRSPDKPNAAQPGRRAGRLRINLSADCDRAGVHDAVTRRSGAPGTRKKTRRPKPARPMCPKAVCYRDRVAGPWADPGRSDLLATEGRQSRVRPSKRACSTGRPLAPQLPGIPEC